ncbi:flagellar basal body-associated FliL family protein [Paracoccaceae bacterium Fryx2]|nr:flagellar basal body-associated FliL family protein [Paracoccaceae bacterium Fryx2]
MIRKLLPLILALVGLGAGLGAGLLLRPAAEPPDAEAAAAKAVPEIQPDYVKLNNQFVVPVVENGRVASMVVLSLSLEAKPGSTDLIYAREPKIRDAFLQVLFDHANSGGFRGSFTDGSNLILLRKALLEAARTTMGDLVTDVLIADIVRQDS